MNSLVDEQHTVDDLAKVIIKGSDERSDLDSNGLNKYGCSPFPQPIFPLGSCTSSSPSTRAWNAAQLAYEKWKTDESKYGTETASEILSEQIRIELGSLFGISREQGKTSIVLSPSGTDVEIMASFLLGSRTEKKIINIITGAYEVGSGTVLAASAQYFSSFVPNGNQQGIGESICEELSSKVQAEQISLRNSMGGVRKSEEIDEEVYQICSAAVEDGDMVLVHLVAHSKTGVFSPTEELIQKLKKQFPSQVFFIVDAAQGRVPPSFIREHIEQGHMIILTGSKFFGGPSFSGALFVPDELNLSEHIRLPELFSDFYCPSNLPATWKEAKRCLKPWVNLGLLLRWKAALEEMKAYFSIHEHLRFELMEKMGNQIRRLIEKLPFLTLVPPYDGNRANDDTHCIDSLCTVFNIQLRLPKNGEKATEEDLRKILKKLYQPESTSTLETVEQLAKKVDYDRFHLGQPVRIGKNKEDFVVRFAIGASHVIDVATNCVYGANVNERLEWFSRQLSSLTKKLKQIMAEM